MRFTSHRPPGMAYALLALASAGLTLLAFTFVAPASSFRPSAAMVALQPTTAAAGDDPPWLNVVRLPTPGAEAVSRDCAHRSTSSRTLILAATRSDDGLAKVATIMAALGSNYETLIADQSVGWPLVSASLLVEGCRGRYDAVVLTTDSLYYLRDGQDVRGLSDADRGLLDRYEVTFGVRELVLFAYPAIELGFAADARHVSGGPFVVTKQGAQIFDYVSERGLRFDGQAGDVATAETGVPLLVDAAGGAAAVLTTGGSTEKLVFTLAPAPGQIDDAVVTYGLVRWVKRGAIASLEPSLAPQVDDLFIPNYVRSGGSYRLGGTDLKALAEWQDSVHTDPLFRDFRIAFAFNGLGATKLDAQDDLIDMVERYRGSFSWISHTYSHRDLDGLDASTATWELMRNQALADRLGLETEQVAVVTPGISGLRNSRFLAAAARFGVRFIVGDASRQPFASLPVNTGCRTMNPAVFVVPRRPTNLFSDATTSKEEVEEFQERYPDLALTRYGDLLEFESRRLVVGMLLGDARPLMFHQSNLRSTAAGQSLLSDLLALTMRRYEAVARLPVTSPTMQDIGRMMQRRDVVREARNVPRRSSALVLDDDVRTLPVDGPSAVGVACAAWRN